jgi:hypothetical protein
MERTMKSATKAIAELRDKVKAAQQEFDNGRCIPRGLETNKTYGMIPMESVREIGLSEVSARVVLARIACALTQ